MSVPLITKRSSWNWRLLEGKLEAQTTISLSPFLAPRQLFQSSHNCCSFFFGWTVVLLVIVKLSFAIPQMAGMDFAPWKVIGLFLWVTTTLISLWRLNVNVRHISKMSPGSGSGTHFLMYLKFLFFTSSSAFGDIDSLRIRQQSLWFHVISLVGSALEVPKYIFYIAYSSLNFSVRMVSSCSICWDDEGGEGRREIDGFARAAQRTLTLATPARRTAVPPTFNLSFLYLC